MGFDERLNDDRRRQAEAARADAEKAERARRAQLQEIDNASNAGLALLPEVCEAITALRRDQERSEALLMAPPYQDDRPRVYRQSNSLGPITGKVLRREKRRFLPGTAVRAEIGFLGWWIRSEPFEFEIPVQGSPQAATYSVDAYHVSPPTSLEAFVQHGVYKSA